MATQKLQQSISIRASKEKIWNVLLDDATYRQWTNVFYPGSYAVCDWQEGSKALFLSPEGSGMVSRVVQHQPREIISFEHLGMVKDGVEDLDSANIGEWKGARETYRLSEHEGVCQLDIELDISDSELESFTKTWEQALQIVKQLSESNT